MKKKTASKKSDKPMKSQGLSQKAPKASAKVALKVKVSAKKPEVEPVAPEALRAKGKTGQKQTPESSKEALQAAAAQAGGTGLNGDEPEVVLTNAEGEQYCRKTDCDSPATSNGLCRLHYLSEWKRNKVKTKILEGGKLDKY